MSLVEQFIYNLYSSVLCSTDNVNVKIQRRQSISVAGMGSDDSSFSPGSAGCLVFQRNTIILLQEGFRWTLLRSNRTKDVTAAQEQVQTTDLCIFLSLLVLPVVNVFVCKHTMASVCNVKQVYYVL